MVNQTPINNSSSSNSEKRKHVFAWSGGKDSTASIIAFHEHEQELLAPGDEVIVMFSEVMFDKKRNISGHNPDIIEFIYETKKVFESWGYTVLILRSDKDYLDIFYHKLKRSKDPSRIGMTYGFPLSGLCSVKRDCKFKPVEQWKKKNFKENDIYYVGIAIDEPKRLESMHKGKNNVSVLEMYNMTEDDAMELCKKHNMLSPQYSMFSDTGKKVKRDGCWFCPNAKLCEHAAIKEKYPNAWKQYVELENEPNLSLQHWNPYTKETLHDRDEYLTYGCRQMNIFDYIA